MNAGTVAPVSDSLVDPAKAAAVERILALNPRADIEFLAQFGAGPLETYLAHLEAAQVPRGPLARWVRPGDSPAICWREAQD
jgi:hypothetical protein